MRMFNCWICNEWVPEQEFMNHLRDHDRNNNWSAFNLRIEFPKSIEECVRRFVPVGLLHIKEVLDSNSENDPGLMNLYS
jgi:hypothetical protein